MQLSVGLVLIKNRKVLMQLRDNKSDIAFPGGWCLPGVHVDDGEPVKEAVKRETLEETGYLLKNPKLFKIEIYKAAGKTVKRHLFYEAYDGQQKINCFEGQKMEFKSPAEFRRMKVFPGHVEFVTEALKLATGTPND